jgi:hypothetical protein
MNVEFRCCKCDGPGGLKWEKMESGFESNGLWFSLRLAGDRSKAIEEYVRVMMRTGSEVVKKCKAPDNSQ